MPDPRLPLGPGRTLHLVLVVGLSACASETPTDRWAGTVDTIQGAVIVSSPATPIDAENTVGLTELWTIGDGGQDAAGRLWEDITRVMVGEDRIFLLDRSADQVYAYERASRDPGPTFGRSGEGPGEFGDPFDLLVFDGRLTVSDPGKGAILMFEEDGALHREIGTPGFVTGALGFETGEIAAHVLVPGTSGQLWMFLDSLGTQLDDLGIPQPLGVTDTLRIGDDTCMRVAAGDARRFLEFGCRIPYVRFIRPDGSTEREFLVDRPPVMSTQEEIDEYMVTYREELSTQFPPQTVDAFVELRSADLRIQPRFDVVRLDPVRGFTLLRETDPLDRENAASTVHLFSRSGAYVTRIDVPEQWTDYALYDGVLYAVRADPLTDLPTLTAYAFDDPGNVLAVDPLDSQN